LERGFSLFLFKEKTTGWPAEIKALAMNGKENLLLTYVMRILVGEKSLHIPNENQ